MTQAELEAELERLKAERDREPTAEELRNALRYLVEMHNKLMSYSGITLPS
jgi:hypothetical protein